MPYRTKTKYPGVYYRQHGSRNHNGKPDLCFDITYKLSSGRKVWEKVGWISENYTAAKASHVRNTRMTAIRHKVELPQKKKNDITFDEFAKKYFKWADENKKSARTDRLRYKRHLQARIGREQISDVSPFDLEKIKSRMKKEGYRPATIKHVLVLVRQMVNKAIVWRDWSGTNPIEGVTLPSLENERTRFLSVEEAQLLLTECNKRSRQLFEIVLVGLHTGMRAGEIFNLTHGDIDYANGLILVRGTKTSQNRFAYPSAEVLNILKNKERLDPNDQSELIFKSQDGGRIKNVSKAFKRAAEELGFNDKNTPKLDRVVFHTLRHTYASWLVMGGTNLYTVAKLLGHKTLTMVDRYSHLCPQQGRQASLSVADKLNEAISKQEALQSETTS